LTARCLVPDAVAPHVTAIRPEALRARGIRGLIVDLDNTLTLWNDARCTPEVAGWLRGLEAADIRVCIVSNNGPERVARFCRGLVSPPPWIAYAGKPRRRAYRRALQRLGLPPATVAVVGDQVFTDVLGGKRAGLWTILVPPLGRREFPATRLVRVVERLWLARLRRQGRLRPL
jgi:HAD superfamily phosphatase (TIGR01668 family)